MKKMTTMSELSTEALSDLLKKNSMLYCAMKEEADAWYTESEIDDLFHDAPKGVEYNIGYPANFVSVLRPSLTYSEEEAVVDWFEDLDRNYAFMPDGFHADAEKAKAFLRILAESDYSPEEEETANKAISAFFKMACDALKDEAVLIYDQFNDEYALADALLSGCISDDYLVDESGKVYKPIRSLILTDNMEAYNGIHLETIG